MDLLLKSRTCIPTRSEREAVLNTLGAAVRSRRKLGAVMRFVKKQGVSVEREAFSVT
ncbi:hypothetical protein TSUD_116520 [Trifolium subterraneum]|uniref:Uncharacterized protein n=1 Tax=Trifolium subterraneum TaxID=3900 RepID=A0A2Z6MDD4_TRISU|nr:hypothetical protein TSUD_116520 [Trifolium subterraneum]